ncbi:hypothetical protein DL764_000004 [Monosporascus ibericus]|uniref:Uncharacterized protein n=1 Tax=Monosporascus ibericus TaxID=155417 RepID=A0A4Q4TVA9_9PEZI|nr:hypothetical protein DL764_000004 [Monosporascus ibericus]
MDALKKEQTSILVKQLIAHDTMACSKKDGKNAGASRAITGGVDDKTGEGSGQQATTAAASRTPASSGFTTSPDMEAARAALDALLESLGATGPDTAATAQEQEEERHTLHHYLSQALSQDLNQGGRPLLSASTASPDVHSSDGELDAPLESVGAIGPDTAATTQEQEERQTLRHGYLNQDQRQGQDHDGDGQDEEKVNDNREADDESLLDRHNRTIAQILTRFRNLIGAATEPLPREGAVLEHAALNRFTMQTEMAALITEIQNLLALNREIKALWIRGPLRKPGENDGLGAEIDRKSAAVADMYQKAMNMFEEKKKAEARAGASSSAPGGGGKSKEVKGEEGVKKESQ